MLYPQLPTFGLIAALLVLIPLPRQIRARNIATISLTWWFFGTCLIASVNAIVWAGNVNDPIPVWCDITTKFQAAATFGLPAATFCICKHLERISSGHPVIPDNKQLRLRKIFEFAMCFILPLFGAFLFYCFQWTRYLIIEDFGCDSSIIYSNVAAVLTILPTLLLSLATLVYGCIALHHLMKNHRTHAGLLASHLKSRNSSLSSTQYYRLMIMSMVLGIWGVVWIAFEFSLNVVDNNNPPPSWKAIHAGDSTPFDIPSIVTTRKALSTDFALWWSIPGAAYLYFLLFGTSRDVLSDYQKFGVSFRTRVLRQTVSAMPLSTTRTGSARTFTLPTYLNTTSIGDDLSSKFPLESLVESDTKVTS